jgi:FtsZ-interacting cell division protein ZipA
MTQNEPKRTNWLLTIIISVILVIFVIIMFWTSAPERQIFDFRSPVKTSSVTPYATETEIFQKTLKALSPDVYKSIQTETDASVRKQLAQDISRLNTEVNELDKAIVQYISPLTKKIQINPKQSNFAYSQEFRKVIGQQNFSPIDFNQPETLNRASKEYQKAAEQLAVIAPSKHFYNFHLFWVTNLASQAYIFQELSRQPSFDRRLVLLHYLNELVKLQNEAVAKLNQ